MSLWSGPVRSGSPVPVGPVLVGPVLVGLVLVGLAPNFRILCFFNVFEGFSGSRRSWRLWERLAIHIPSEDIDFHQKIEF